MTATFDFYTKDHPTASGRVPVPGERAYQFLFPLHNGDSLVIHCGDETIQKFREFLGSMAIDDAAEESVKP